MKESALNRVEIVDIEPDIFQTLLRFIYTDQVIITKENSKSLLAAADRYFLNLLKWKCEDFLSQDLTVQNCSEMLMLAHSHDAAYLKDAVVSFIRKSTNEVMDSNEWKELKKSCPELAFEILELLLRKTT